MLLIGVVYQLNFVLFIIFIKCALLEKLIIHSAGITEYANIF